MNQSEAISDDPLRFYEKRLKELETLKSGTSSKTVEGLIQRAIDLSQSSLPKLLNVIKETTAYLRQEQSKYDASIVKIDEQIDLLRNEIKKLEDASEIPKEMKAPALVELNRALELGLKTKKNKYDVTQLQFAVMPQTANSFQNVLLNLIYKPNQTSFHYDTVIDGLKLLGGILIPVLESLNTASSTPISPTVRKKQYIKTGDKVIIYIEQYIDVLEKWNAFADQYSVVLAE